MRVTGSKLELEAETRKVRKGRDLMEVLEAEDRPLASSSWTAASHDGRLFLVADGWSTRRATTSSPPLPPPHAVCSTRSLPAPVDALSQAIVALKKGAHLLKCGKRGNPKFCPLLEEIIVGPVEWLKFYTSEIIIVLGQSLLAVPIRTLWLACFFCQEENYII